MTEVYVCCTHKYQNEKYGGKTVHNQKKNGEYKCTVCGKIYSKVVKAKGTKQGIYMITYIKGDLFKVITKKGK